MEIEIKGYLTEIGILKSQLDDTIRGLSDEAANWKPLPEGANSIYVILSHLVGSQNDWVRRVINGEVVPRDRNAEFRASGRFSELLSRWEKVCQDTDAILGKLKRSQLAETRDVSVRPEWGVITVRWCILHVISHLALHLGHAQLTRQMWEQRQQTHP